jgi:hypothetical protein
VTPVTASEAESGHATRAVDTEAPPEVAAEAGRSLASTSPIIQACPRQPFPKNSFQSLRSADGKGIRAVVLPPFQGKRTKASYR